MSLMNPKLRISSDRTMALAMRMANLYLRWQVGMLLMEEICVSTMMTMLLSMSLSLRKPQWAYPHLHNPPQLKLLCTG